MNTWTDEEIHARQHVANPYGQANRKHLAPLACSHNREGKTVARTGLVES